MNYPHINPNLNPNPNPPPPTNAMNYPYYHPNPYQLHHQPHPHSTPYPYQPPLQSSLPPPLPHHQPPPPLQPIQNLSVGLLRKHQKNDIQSYAKLSRLLPSSDAITANNFYDFFTNNFKQHPEEYFNFGFNYNDFKQFLLKLLYMRAERRFFEKSFTERDRARYPGQDGEDK